MVVGCGGGSSGYGDWGCVVAVDVGVADVVAVDVVVAAVAGCRVRLFSKVLSISPYGKYGKALNGGEGMVART